MEQDNQAVAYARITRIRIDLRDGAYGDGDDLGVEDLEEDLNDVTADM